MSLVDGITQETTVTLGALAAALTLVVTVAGILLNSLRRRSAEQSRLVESQNKAIAGLSEDVRELSGTLELRLQAIEGRVDACVHRDEWHRWILEVQADNRDLDVPIPIRVEGGA